MSVRNSSGRLLLALVSGAVLSACSPSASTAVPPVEASSTPAPALLPVAAQAVAATPPAAAEPVQPLVSGLPDFTRLVETYGPAVVNVRVEAQGRNQTRALEQLIPGLPGFEFRIPGERGPQRGGEGSGFIVSSDGYILTNAHVVEGVDEVVVRMSDRREFDARVIGTDTRTDVAVLKVEARNLPTVRIGDPSKLKPGQWVVAIGSPFGMQNSVTAGIVSATSRELSDDAFVPFIQTDAAVNPGNSGGPLFNLQGEVVGINSQIYSQNGGYMGLSFAVPIDIADIVREQLVSTGRVTRSILGVQVYPQPMSAMDAEAWGLDRPRGALVQAVGENSPAEQAGIRQGDIILSVDGKPVDSFTTLVNYISPLKPGTETTLEVWRNSRMQKIKARVVEDKQAEEPRTVPTRNNSGPRGAEPARPEQVSEGLSVRLLTPEEKRMVETEGTLVVEEATGPAAASNLQRGDIILDVANTPVTTVDELKARIKATSGRVVPLRIQRRDAIGYQTLRKQ
jgi:serine protease Do